MITSDDLKKIDIESIDFEKLEMDIDNSIKQFHGFYPWEYAIVDYEIPFEVRNIIARKYKENGWKYVYHRTSRENNEKPGYTSFKFSNKKN